MGFVGDDDIPTTGMIKGVEQFHAELLQALLLTLPPAEWGSQPCPPATMADLFETVPTLAMTAFHKRLLDGPKSVNGKPTAAASLQERIRLHTQAVRNWGYYSEVLRISSEVYAPLDVPFGAALGFGATDLLKIANVLVKETERRGSARMSALARTLRGKNPRQLVRLYYANFPDLIGSPEDVIDSLPGPITRERMVTFIMWHSELRLPDTMIHTPEQVAGAAGVSVAVAQAVLEAISMKPGDLDDVSIGHLFLSNPIWTRPVIDLGGRYFVPVPQALFSHIHGVIRDQAEGVNLAEKLETARASYLEAEVERIIRQALPGAHIIPNAKWQADGRSYETDVLAIVDRTILILEAKSHHLTGPGLRGGPDRMKRHISDLVVDPSIQSDRLEKLIWAAAKGDATAKGVVSGLGIDATSVDRVIRLSVTLDDFSVLSSSEKEMIEAGWSPADHALAPSIHLGDLICVAHILDRPILFLHYLSERFHLQKTFDLMGDELDFLGLYLETSFNIQDLGDQPTTFNISGLSRPIDQYFMGQDAGLKVKKPAPTLHSDFIATIDRLAETKPDGWTTIGLDLLGACSFDEQKRLYNNLRDLRASVRKHFRDEDHISSLVLNPKDGRKAAVVFHLYPDALKDSLRSRMRQLADQTMSDLDCSSCVMVGRSIDRWHQPFDAILHASASASSFR